MGSYYQVVSLGSSAVAAGRALQLFKAPFACDRQLQPESRQCDISAVAARVTTAEGIITTQGTSITQNANDISVVAARMTKAEGDISTNTTQIGINASGISAITTNLNDSTLARNYTAIQVMQDGIASKVAMGDVTSYFQQDHTGFYIKGSLINIDGDTVINAAASSAIVNAIQANSIDASKLNVSTLSAICATIGVLRTATSGARLEVRSNQIRVYDANDVLRVQLGVF